MSLCNSKTPFENSKRWPVIGGYSVTLAGVCHRLTRLSASLYRLILPSEENSGRNSSVNNALIEGLAEASRQGTGY